MPAPGDQHSAIANPFEEPQQRISGYTAKEIATLQSRLDKQLGPEYLSTRPGGGGQKVHYITAEKVIGLANEVFGFNGWSSSIVNFQVDYIDELPQQRVNMGISVVVRVTLRDGTYHEDIGYGHIENAKGKAAAFEKTKKEATTDALKRALRLFGNVLGNCVYDKTYLANVTKVKAAPARFDESRLHRYSEGFAKNAALEPVPKEEKAVERKPVQPAPPPPQLPSEESFDFFLGELDEADFNISDEGHPDEVALPNSNETESNQSIMSNKSNNQANDTPSHMQPPTRQFGRATSAGNPPRQPPQTPAQQPPRPNANNFPGAGGQDRGPPAARPPQQFVQNRPATRSVVDQSHNQNQPHHLTPPQPGAATNPAPGGGSGGGEFPSFFSARTFKAVDNPDAVLDPNKNNHLNPNAAKLTAPKPGQAFNPHLQSPSIPRTPGVDHSASKPLAKSGKHVAALVRGEGDEEGGVAVAASEGGGGGMGNGFGKAPGAGAAAVAGRGPAGPGAVVNPQLDQARRIGAPAGAVSPLGNRGQFRPLTVKRPAGAGAGVGVGAGMAGHGVGRVPLESVSTNGVVVNGGGRGDGGSGPDLKRQRTS